MIAGLIVKRRKTGIARLKNGQHFGDRVRRRRGNRRRRIGPENGDGQQQKAW